jgi:hypothetical protein
MQVMIQESDYYEHFYHALKPYEHYMPVNRSLTDLVEKYAFCAIFMECALFILCHDLYSTELSG